MHPQFEEDTCIMHTSPCTFNISHSINYSNLMYTKNVDSVHGMWTVCMECRQCAWNVDSVHAMWTAVCMRCGQCAWNGDVIGIAFTEN